MFPPTLARGAASYRRQTLHTDGVPEPARFAYWLDLVCSAYVRVDCDDMPESGFFGRMEFNPLGPLELTQVASNAQHVVRTRAQIRQETEDYCLVHVQRHGRGCVRQAGREAVLEAGDLVVYDCARPYELSFQGGYHEVSVLRLSRAQLKQHVNNFEDLTATLISGRESGGQLVLSLIDTLRREAERLHPASLMGVTEGLTSLVGAGLRGLPAANARQPTHLHHYHVLRIKQFLQDHLHDPELSPAQISKALGLSEGHIRRLFRAEPAPLMRLIWQLRIEACRRDLVDQRLASRSISEIAYSWGFADATHFSRMFRETFGQSPREWRAAPMAPMALTSSERQP
jgi:AraC-like DNA-binding protein